MAHILYAGFVGSLIYEMVCTQLDISQAVRMVSRFMHDPRKCHWQVAKWILRYILGIVDLGLKFGRDDNVGSHLVGYCWKFRPLKQ